MSKLELGLVAVALVTILRAYSLLRSTFWISEHVHQFEARSRQRAIPQYDHPGLWTLFDQCGGRFFPFGPKSYRLARWASMYSGPLRNLVKMLLTLVRYMWRLYFFVPIVFVGLFVVSFIPDRELSNLEAVTLGVGILVFVAYPIVVTAEAFVCFIRIDSWGFYYHRFGGARPGDRVLSEFKSGFGALLVLVLCILGPVVVATERFKAFASYSQEGKDNSDALTAVGDGLYRTVQLLLFNADPLTGLGRAVAGFAVIDGFCVVVLLAGKIASVGRR